MSQPPPPSKRKVKKNKKKLGPAPQSDKANVSTLPDVAPSPAENQHPLESAPSSLNPSESTSEAPKTSSKKKKNNKKGNQQQTSNLPANASEQTPGSEGFPPQPETSTKKPKNNKKPKQKNNQNSTTAPPGEPTPFSVAAEHSIDVAVSQATEISEVTVPSVIPTTKKPKIIKKKIEKATPTPASKIEAATENNPFMIVPFKVEWVTVPKITMQTPTTPVHQHATAATESQFIELFVPGAPSVEEILAKAGVFAHGIPPVIEQQQIQINRTPILEVLAPQNPQVHHGRVETEIFVEKPFQRPPVDLNSPFFSWLGDFRSKMNVHMNRLKKSFDGTFPEAPTTQ